MGQDWTDGVTRKQLVDSQVLTIDAKASAVPSWFSSCPRGCGKQFGHGPPLVAHQKVCRYAKPIGFMSVEPETPNPDDPIEDEHAADDPTDAVRDGLGSRTEGDEE